MFSQLTLPQLVCMLANSDFFGIIISYLYLKENTGYNLSACCEVSMCICHPSKVVQLILMRYVTLYGVA